MDQDIPGNVVRSNTTPLVAWENYIRPIREEKLYIPPRLFESDVTTRYLDWWQNSMPAQSADSSDGERNLKRMRQSEGLVGKDSSSDGKKNPASVPQSFVLLKMEDNNGPLVPPGFSPKFSGMMASEGRPSVSFPPGFPPPCIKEEARDSVDEDEITLGEFVKKTKGGKNKPRMGTRLQNPSVSSTADNMSLQSIDQLMMKFMKPVELKKIGKSTVQL